MATSDSRPVRPHPHRDRPSEHGPSSTAATYVGVDLGVNSLYVAAPASAGARVTDALETDGTVERLLYEELMVKTRRLRALDVDTRPAEQRALAYYRELLTHRFARAAAGLLEYLSFFEPRPTVVLEDLPFKRLSLATCQSGHTEVGTWLLPAFQDRLATALTGEGYDVRYVDPDHTSQECHLCGRVGDLDDDLTCTTAGCPVETVDSDRSAAVSIARRGAEPDQ